MDTNPSPNHELLMRLKPGDEQAFEVLYMRHASAFHHFSVAKGLSPYEADDVVDETFERILTCISDYSEVICGGERWMWSICRNKVNDLLRAKKRQALQLLEGYASPEETNPATLVEQQEHIHVVNQALAKLSDADREQLQRGRGRKAWHLAVEHFRLFVSE